MPQLVRLCLPLLAANVLQQLYNIINSLVVTYYIGDSAFAALGVAESVMNLFIYVITGACMGASVLIAQFTARKTSPVCGSSSMCPPSSSADVPWVPSCWARFSCPSYWASSRLQRS